MQDRCWLRCTVANCLVLKSKKSKRSHGSVYYARMGLVPVCYKLFFQSALWHRQEIRLIGRIYLQVWDGFTWDDFLVLKYKTVEDVKGRCQSTCGEPFYRQLPASCTVSDYVSWQGNTYESGTSSQPLN